MKIGNIASLVIIVGAAGGLAIGLSGDKKEDPIDPVNPGVAEMPKLTEADVLPHAIKVGNRHVYVAGMEKKSERIVDVSVGRVLEHDPSDASADILCPVIIEAREKGNMPDVGIFDDAWRSGGNHIPEKLELSESGGKWMWYVVFKGADCVRVASLNEYVGSSMEEFINLPMSQRRRILRKIVACGDENKFSCIVPIENGDTSAFFPKELAGREDLKFMGLESGKIKKRNAMKMFEDMEAVEIDPVHAESPENEP
jgi:hypothetical protein